MVETNEQSNESNHRGVRKRDNTTYIRIKRTVHHNTDIYNIIGQY
jgi:hypothetical protein